MGRAVIDLTGQRYGMLTVLRMDDKAVRGAGKSSQWVVRCDCGNERAIASQVLRCLGQKSCGCQRGVGGRFEPKYGIPKSAFQRWTNMMRRCYSPASEKDSRNYMERGIAVCDKWHDPRQFYADMGDPPFVGATLDRVDNDRGYSPENCRWATYTEQNNNRGTYNVAARKRHGDQ